MRDGNSVFSRCFIAVLAVFLTGLLSSAVVFAEPWIPEKKVIYLQEGITSENIQLEGVSKTSAITKLKSSKKSVATVSKFVHEGTAYVAVEPKKPGTAKITFNVKYGKKTIKAKTTVIVRKYENPLKTFKIGSKNYASKFNKSGHVTLEKKKLKGKLNVKLKSGYELVEIAVYSWKDGSGYKNYKNNKSVTVASGKTLSVQVCSKDDPDRTILFTELRLDD